MLYYFYVSKAGSPQTGYVDTTDLEWETLVTAENGTDKSGSAPAFTEVGGGWYSFDIAFGTAPWDVITEDLVGVIDCDTGGNKGLEDVDRYKPVSITKRGLGLARIAHKGIQNKASGDVDIYATDDTTKEMKLDMTDSSTEKTRAPAAP